jgi:hypothetical protein
MPFFAVSGSFKRPIPVPTIEERSAMRPRYGEYNETPNRIKVPEILFSINITWENPLSEKRIKSFIFWISDVWRIYFTPSEIGILYFNIPFSRVIIYGIDYPKSRNICGLHFLI